MKLVIVESPNKVKTIQNYLGSDYKVIASVGHIVEMTSEGEMNLGINFENWEPIYKIASDKLKVYKQLKEFAKNAEIVYIATDPDREGEAIGENLVHFLNLYKSKNYKRIKYNEITKDAILKSINNATDLDFNLVKAQKARRMLDRIIGFRLSNLIASKIQNSPVRPTAGRVQSIGLKLVVDRDREIENFEPVPFSTIEAIINDDVVAKYFNLENNEFESKEWVTRETAEKIVSSLKNELIIDNVESEQKSSKRIEPLKQSILYKKSPVGAKETQASLQRLFEGFGDHGLITYPRTDSTRIAPEFFDKAHEFIKNNYGQEFISKEIKSSAGEQDAHEAIRPTDISLIPKLAQEKYSLNQNDFLVYSLIWETTIKAFMRSPVNDILKCELSSGEHKFKMSFSKNIFEGYDVVSKKNDVNNQELPTFKKGDVVKVKNFQIKDSKTTPPSRYSDGSLIDKLDKIKVGRPSTFATTVEKIIERKFVEKDKDKLVSTKFGQEVLKKLIEGFPNEINESYTAMVEGDLDLIAEGKKNKESVMNEFWERFQVSFQTATNTLELTIMEDKRIKNDCPKCNSKLSIKYSKTNKEEFIGCTNYPECKYTKSLKTTNNTKGKSKKSFDEKFINQLNKKIDKLEK